MTSPALAADLNGHALELVRDLANTGVVTDTSLTIDRDLSYDQAEAFASLLGEFDRFGKRARERASWWVGDFCLYAEQVHGDLFAQIAEATKLAPQTLLNRMSICRAIPPAQRREGVNFSVHAEVAYMASRERTKLLERAAREDLTREEVRAAKRGATETEPKPVVEHETCPTCGQEIKP